MKKIVLSTLAMVALLMCAIIAWNGHHDIAAAVLFWAAIAPGAKFTEGVDELKERRG